MAAFLVYKCNNIIFALERQEAATLLGIPAADGCFEVICFFYFQNNFSFEEIKIATAPAQTNLVFTTTEKVIYLACL